MKNSFLHSVITQDERSKNVELKQEMESNSTSDEYCKPTL